MRETLVRPAFADMCYQKIDSYDNQIDYLHNQHLLQASLLAEAHELAVATWLDNPKPNISNLVAEFAETHDQVGDALATTSNTLPLVTNDAGQAMDSLLSLEVGDVWPEIQDAAREHGVSSMYATLLIGGLKPNQLQRAAHVAFDSMVWDQVEVDADNYGVTDSRIKAGLFGVSSEPVRKVMLQALDSLVWQDLVEAPPEEVARVIAKGSGPAVRAAMRAGFDYHLLDTLIFKGAILSKDDVNKIIQNASSLSARAALGAVYESLKINGEVGLTSVDILHPRLASNQSPTLASIVARGVFSNKRRRQLQDFYTTKSDSNVIQADFSRQPS